MKGTASIRVQGKPDEVFAYLADFSNTAEWDPGVVSAKKRGGGPVGVGTKFGIVSRFLGREVPLAYRVVQYDPPSRVALEAENASLRSVDTLTFEKKARKQGAELVLTNIRPEIYEVFAITKLNKLFEIKDDEADALAML